MSSAPLPDRSLSVIVNLAMPALRDLRDNLAELRKVIADRERSLTAQREAFVNVTNQERELVEILTGLGADMEVVFAIRDSEGK